MPRFIDDWRYSELLTISKQQLDAIENRDLLEKGIIGQSDNNRLLVSTVFAAIAIEAALNDFIKIHALYIERAYLQSFCGIVIDHYIRSSVINKIDLVRKLWTDEFPDHLIRDVRTLFQIRNRITHQSGKYIPDGSKGPGATFSMMCSGVFVEGDVEHMLRHHSIACDFLSRFWFPGDRELLQE